MPTFGTANSKSDLDGILSLQKANHVQSLSASEIQSQGFVTVNHSYEQLKNLNDIEKHVIAKAEDRIIGYVLAMTQRSRYDIPILLPMFDAFDKIIYKGKKISEYHYIVVGQVCIDKIFRGTGVFNKCYSAYKECYQDRYDFAITEIAARNTRSLQAHRRIGFKEINSYSAPDKTEWIVVIWDW